MSTLGGRGGGGGIIVGVPGRDPAAANELCREGPDPNAGAGVLVRLFTDGLGLEPLRVAMAARTGSSGPPGMRVIGL